MHCWHDYQMKNSLKSWSKLHSILMECMGFFSTSDLILMSKLLIKATKICKTAQKKSKVMKEKGTIYVS